MKIVAFGASHSKQSINKQFATYVASKFAKHDVQVIDLNDYALPLYTIDVENEQGYPENALRFVELLSNADLIIISLAEHNGSYTAGFKNLMDWSSRVQSKFFHEKKLLLLSTSPGGGGAKFVLEAAKVRFPRHGATLVGAFSLPSFNENFDAQNGILNDQLEFELNGLLQELT